MKRKLNFYSGKDSVTAILTDLGCRWDSFSRTFCIEKDLVNHEFRTLVEDYAIAMTSDLRTISWYSLVLYPSYHLGAFINGLFRSRWLPQPQLYSLQVKAAMRFRTKQFINEAMASLKRVDLLRLPNPVGLTEAFDAALAMNSVYQQHLEAMIKQSTFADRWMGKNDIKAVKRASTLAKNNRRLILDIKMVAGNYGIYTQQLTNKLIHMRQNLADGDRFEFSPTSFWSFSEPSLGSFNSSNSARNLAFRSKIARLCKNRENGRTVPREMYAVCLLNDLRVTVSIIDDDIFFNVQRNWYTVRTEAMDRYDIKTKSDLESGIDIMFEYSLEIENSVSDSWR